MPFPPHKLTPHPPSSQVSLVAQTVKESACNAGDLGLIPGLGQSPGEGTGYPLQYSGMENSMDYSPWGRKELDTASDLHFHFLHFT